jgi:hypothetical protein
LQNVSPALPGQQLPATHADEQQTSAELIGHVALSAVPVQLPGLATHTPVPVLQIGSDELAAAHCASLVHLPHWFGVTIPHIGPFVLPLQSTLTRQLPGVQTPLKHK